MLSKIKYIILVSDDEANASLLLDIIKGIARSVQSDVAKNFRQLSALLKKKLPDLIIIHFKKPGGRYGNWPGKLRKNDGIDKIPILIYPALPQKKELSDLLKQLKKL